MYAQVVVKVALPFGEQLLALLCVLVVGRSAVLGVSNEVGRPTSVAAEVL